MSSGQQGDDKNSMAILWAIAGIFLVLGAIWWGFSEQLKMLFIGIRKVELILVYWVVRWFNFVETNLAIERSLEILRLVSPSNLSLPLAEELSNQVGEYLRWPIAGILLVFVYINYMRNVKNRYKKRYDTERLAVQESAEWPQINPVTNINLVKKELDEGPWAMAMPPMLFCKKHNLLDVTLDKRGDLFKKGPKFKAILNETKAESVFTAQLGRLWKSPESMPIHRRAIFAAFVARGMRDSDAARELIMKINRSCKGSDISSLDFSGADELWKKHYHKREVQEVIQAHAYEYTVLTALFLFAREDGVFSCSDFLWLKPKDRQFWYVLNNVGRQTPYCEAAGVHAHFLAEKSLNRRLNSAVIKEAVVALQLALNEIVYLPTPEEKDKILAAEAGN